MRLPRKIVNNRLEIAILSSCNILQPKGPALLVGPKVPSHHITREEDPKNYMLNLVVNLSKTNMAKPKEGIAIGSGAINTIVRSFGSSSRTYKTCHYSA